MDNNKHADSFLEKRLTKYDEWLGSGRVAAFV
jgi:hypothetical protein